MKKFISWIVGIGVLTGVGSAFTSAYEIPSAAFDILGNMPLGGGSDDAVYATPSDVAETSNNIEKALNYLAAASNNDACDEYGSFFSKDYTEKALSYLETSNNTEKALNYLAEASNNTEKALNYLAAASNNDACDEYGSFFSKDYTEKALNYLVEAPSAASNTLMEVPSAVSNILSDGRCDDCVYPPEFSSAYEIPSAVSNILSDGRCDDCVYPEFSFAKKLEGKNIKD